MLPSSDWSIQGRTDLAALWQASREGRVYFAETYCAQGRAFGIVEGGVARQAPSSVGATMLERIFEGESQKALAIEHGMSVATVATQCGDALRSITPQFSVSHAPILVVMAALAASGLPLGHARLEGMRADGSWLLSTELPGETFRDRLSESEQDVAHLSIEGATHVAMALRRGTSRRTVANQLASIFRKLNISGRGALRALAIREYAHSRVCRCRRPEPAGVLRLPAASPLLVGSIG